MEGRIDTVLTHKVHKFVTTGAAQLVLGPNAHRKGVLLQGINGQIISYKFGEAPTEIVDGITFITFDEHVYIDTATYGEGVKGSLHAFAAIAAFVGSVVEVTGE